MTIQQITKTPAIDLSLDTLKQDKQAIVFAESKRSAEKTAEDIARKIKNVDHEELAHKILTALPAPTKQCTRLAACIKRGIAFHHAGLVTKQRELIEENFRNGTIKIICATPTLAMGVDLPAFRVILKSLKRFSNWGMAWIPTLEYLQMAGRAGRPKFHDTHGEAIAIAKSEGENDEIYERYVTGEPEPVYSKLAVEPVLRTYILSLIATGFVRNRSQLVDFFSRTFWAHQYKDMEKLEAIIDKMLALLEKWEFIVAKTDDFVSAADLGADITLKATTVGRRVAELYIDPYTAHHFVKGLLKNKKPTAFALLQRISHTLEMRPLLRVRSKEYEEIQAILLEHYEDLLEMEPDTYDPRYDEFMNSIKTTSFFNEWIDESSEEELLQKFMVRPGEIRVKSAIADWLLYAMSELAPLLKAHDVLKEVKKLRTRVKYGVKEELLTLLRLDGVGRVRARKLYRAKLRNVTELKKADISQLTHLLGSKTAIKIKKQLGQEVKEVSSTKRKGQVSLNKFD
jgi:helicase